MGGPTQAGSSGVFLQDKESGQSPDIIPTDDHNGLVTVTPGHISADNSTREILDADLLFTGEWEDITNYGIIVISVTSDVASATDGLVVQFSSDGTEAGIISDDVYSLTAEATKTWSFQAAAKFYRVIFTNGAIGQASFNLQTILKPYYVKPSSHRIQDSIVDDDDAELVKAVLTGQKPDETFINFQSTAGGNFKVSLEELENTISEDVNTTLRVAPIIIDEYGNIQRQLGDNIFRGAVVSISPEHHEIHCGDSYELSTTGDLGNGASIEVLVIVPAWGAVDPTNPGDDQGIKLAHAKGIIDVEAEALIEFFEAPTVTNNGTPAADPINRNRNSENVDFLSFFTAPTIAADGLNLWSKRVGSGKQVGGTAGRGDEFVLKNNTAYLLRVTNANTTNNYYNIEFDYYVHPGI